MGDLELLISGQQFAEISIVSTLLNLTLCMLTVSTVAWYYKRYSRVLGGKAHIGSVLPLIGLTVFLVITVVKSSLALSLGLVGALSIVRFRTPIKEPEELGFLFLTIAIGLGFGAGFQLVTASVTSAILLFLRFFGGNSKKEITRGEYTIVLKTKIESYQLVTNEFRLKFSGMKIERIESSNNFFEIYMSVSLNSDFNISEMFESIKKIDDQVEIQMVESGVNW
jgi:hypothetical protein